MKKLLLPIIAIGSLHIAFSQVPPDKISSDRNVKTEKSGDMLEYITEKAFYADLPTGKIKPNTFYWANAVNDQTLIPTSKMDGTVPCLEIRGGTKGEMAKSFLYRLIPVQEVKGAAARAANVSIDVNFEPNLWAPHAPGANKPAMEVFFVDGERVSGGQRFPITESKPNVWSTAKRQFAIPPGGKFIGITITAPASYVVRIRNINISFE